MRCDLKEKICNLVDFNKKQIYVHNFHPSMMANMDEMPIWADMPSTTAIELRGSHTVPIRTTGHEKNRLTVCLCVKADGTKLKRYVVIPARKVKKELCAIPGVAVVASPSGWMNEKLTADWIEKIKQIFLLLNECLFGILLSVTFLMRGKNN